MDNKPLSYTKQKNHIMDSMTTSFWIKGALASLDTRDPLAALLDVAYLSKLMALRVKETQARDERIKAVESE